MLKTFANYHIYLMFLFGGIQYLENCSAVHGIPNAKSRTLRATLGRNALCPEDLCAAPSTCTLHRNLRGYYLA